MSSKFDGVLPSTVFKPLPPRPRRRKELKNLFPPAAEPQEPSPGSLAPAWSAEASSPTVGSPLPLHGPPQVCVPGAPLNNRPYQDQKPVRDPAVLEARLSEMVRANKSLRQANKVLYQQNSDYSDLLQEYRANHKTLIDCLSSIKDSVDGLQRISETVRSDTRSCQKSIRSAEKEAIKDWARFVEMSKGEGLEVDKVLEDIVNDQTTEIVVYPYKQDCNMI